MIPQLIHRIWLDDPMPDEFERYGELWDKLHPDWTRCEWRSAKTLPRMHPGSRQLFDRARDIMPRDWKRFQSDILRLELLWYYGGVYADTDVEPLKAFDPLLHQRHGAFAGWSANTVSGGARPITQAILGAEPRNAFIGACIEELERSVRRHAGRSLAKMIGPWMITRVYRRFAYEDGGVPAITVYPPRFFYPQSNDERDRGRALELGEDAYAHHKWANTRDRRRGGVA